MKIEENNSREKFNERASAMENIIKQSVETCENQKKQLAKFVEEKTSHQQEMQRLRNAYSEDKARDTVLLEQLEKKVKELSSNFFELKKQEKETNAMLEQMTKNDKALKEEIAKKTKENEVLRVVYNKTKESGNEALKKAKTKEMQAREEMEYQEDAMKNQMFAAAVTTFYWEILKIILGDAVDNTKYREIANSIIHDILKTTNMVDEDQTEFTDEFFLQTRLHASYVAENTLHEDTTKSNAYFVQLRAHLDDFHFIVPPKPKKISTNNKKKKIVNIVRYAQHGNIRKELKVYDHSTLEDVQEVLNKSKKLPPLTPMVFFAGKIKNNNKFMISHTFSLKDLVMKSITNLQNNERLYFSSVIMDADDAKDSIIRTTP